MLWMQSGNIKMDRMLDFQAWVKKNEDLMQKYAPPGWKYRGTYAYVLGFGRFSFASMWECNTYSDFDTFREHDDETWMRLNQEFLEFMTEEPGEAVLLREIGDTKIVEPKKKRK